MLFKIFPIFSMNNTANGSCCNMIFLSKECLCKSLFSFVSYFNDLLLCKFRSSRGFSFSGLASTPGKHFLNIHVLVSEMQTIWIYTSWIIARMQYLHSFWNWTNEQFIRNPMSIILFPVDLCFSISGFIFCSCPLPVAIYISHKSFENAFAWVLSCWHFSLLKKTPLARGQPHKGMFKMLCRSDHRLTYYNTKAVTCA